MEVYRQGPLFQALHLPQHFHGKLETVSSAAFVGDRAHGLLLTPEMLWEAIRCACINR